MKKSLESPQIRSVKVATQQRVVFIADDWFYDPKIRRRPVLVIATPQIAATTTMLEHKDIVGIHRGCGCLLLLSWKKRCSMIVVANALPRNDFELILSR